MPGRQLRAGLGGRAEAVCLGELRGVGKARAADSGVCLERAMDSGLFHGAEVALSMSRSRTGQDQPSGKMPRL